MIFHLLVKGSIAEATTAAEAHGFPTMTILSASQKETRLEVDTWNAKLVYDWYGETDTAAIAKFLPGTLLHFSRKSS